MMKSMPLFLVLFSMIAMPVMADTTQVPTSDVKTDQEKVNTQKMIKKKKLVKARKKMNETNDDKKQDGVPH